MTGVRDVFTFAWLLGTVRIVWEVGCAGPGFVVCEPTRMRGFG